MAQFLTFVIGSNAPEGTFEVTGAFDESWGFSLLQGPSGRSQFGTISLMNDRLRVHWKGGMNHRFNLRFADTNADGYRFSGGNLGQMVAQTAELRDTPHNG